MIFIACGPSNSGKTFLVREWLLPTLLTDPGSLSDAAPERFRLALIDDPPTRRRPQGQYPGVRYRDVSEFRRAGRKARVACFDQADARELCGLAWELGDVVLVLDELDLRLSNQAPLSEVERNIVHKGRHSGIALVGTMRRLHGVRPEVRANLQVAFFGGLTEPEDRRYAAQTAGVDEALLREIPPRTFLEFRRETGERYLTQVQDGERVVLQRL